MATTFCKTNPEGCILLGVYQGMPYQNLTIRRRDVEYEDYYILHAPDARLGEKDPYFCCAMDTTTFEFERKQPLFQNLFKAKLLEKISLSMYLHFDYKPYPIIARTCAACYHKQTPRPTLVEVEKVAGVEKVVEVEKTKRKQKAKRA